MDIFEGCLLSLVSHQRLQRRNVHVLVCLVGAERVPQRMHAHPFADPGFLDVLGDNRPDGGDV